MISKPDIVIFGAGIAGLYTFHLLKKRGYDVLLLEREAIGGGQSIAAQGIIHSGLKFTLAGKVNKLAQSISEMPLVWRNCLKGEGPINLTKTMINTDSQLLMIPSGFVGGITKMVTERLLAKSVHEILPDGWPQPIKNAGFHGSLIYMDELVIDVPSLIKNLAEPYKDCIRKCPHSDPFAFLNRHGIEPKKIIFTAAESNESIARYAAHDKGLQVQKRPLLQGMIRNAPFPLYAHLVGTSEKPVMTITTHTAHDGSLIWYLGGGVAEHPKDSDPEELFEAARKALKTYLPNLNHGPFEWAALPIDRVEGKSDTDHWMPDTPTIHQADECVYCWPTKLTFAPMLGDMILKSLEDDDIKPSGITNDYSFLPEVAYAAAPWDTALWRK